MHPDDRVAIPDVGAWASSARAPGLGASACAQRQSEYADSNGEPRIGTAAHGRMTWLAT